MAYAYFAEIYDEVMRCVDYPQWAEYVLNLCRHFDLPREPLLNLACGTGSLERELIQRGVTEILSMDASEEMLAVAERKFVEERTARPVFRVGQMEQLDLDRRFGLVTCLYDSVNYLVNEKSVRGMLSGVFRHLEPGGGFIFDVTSEFNIVSNFDDYTFSENCDGYSYIWENRYSIEKKIITSHVTIFAREGELYRKHEEDHVQKIYATADLRRWSKEAGFDVLGVFSEFTRDAPHSRSERIHFVLRRPQPS